jgi:ribosomal protein L12E/L44/L45/RPP1/RPP2
MSDVSAAPEGGGNRKLNRAVGISVVVLSTVMALGKVKDDNIVQAMQKAKADAVDTWSEYQAARLKLHLSEASLAQARTVAAAVPAAAAALQAQATEQQAAIDKYTARSKELSDKAKAYEQSYDAMNYRDDQFDMADVFLSIAMAVIGVSALIESWPLLLLGWASASVGALMVAAGFAGWTLHSDWLASLLG